MKNILHTEWAPPEWSEDRIKKNLGTISKICRAVSVIELGAVTASAEKILTDEEMLRYINMGERRKKSYLGSRAACKYLSQKLSDGPGQLPANMINTVVRDQPYPQCPLPDGSTPFFCSASHDSAYAFAAASEKRIGADVEIISERVLKALTRFMDEREISLIKTFPHGDAEAALRVWSIKECVTKALGINMHESWKIAHVTETGINTSSVLVNNKNYKAYHDTAGDHIFTVLLIK